METTAQNYLTLYLSKREKEIDETIIFQLFDMLIKQFPSKGKLYKFHSVNLLNVFINFMFGHLSRVNSRPMEVLVRFICAKSQNG
jgi:hypothetical protein